MSTELKTIVTIDYPFENGLGEKITQLEVRRVKVKDMRAMSTKGSDEEKEIYLLSQIAGLIPEDFDLMDLADYSKLQKLLQEMTQGKSKKRN